MGTLYLVSTPIGNLDDVSLRACKTFSTVDIILCEDTRRTGIFLAELKKRSLIPENTKPQLISYYDQIEQQRIPEVIEYLSGNKTIALISDAGTPLVSDPGFRLVEAARKREIPVISIPGASALLTALVSSGLPTNQFTFLGFIPEKKGKQIALLTSLKTFHTQTNQELQPTYVFYCAPHKLQTAFDSLFELFGDIQIVVSRELTKIHEDYFKGTVTEAKLKFTEPKGEFVVLFSLT
jgi:16S rRNA (cytidine1402-2'-O)-methyltransferase